KNSRRVNGVWVPLTKIHELLHFRDDVVCCRGHEGIKISCGLTVNEVSPAVAFPGFHKCELAAQSAFHNVLSPIKFTRLFSLGNHGAHSSRCKEGRHPGPASTQAFRQGA